MFYFLFFFLLFPLLLVAFKKFAPFFVRSHTKIVINFIQLFYFNEDLNGILEICGAGDVTDLSRVSLCYLCHTFYRHFVVNN